MHGDSRKNDKVAQVNPPLSQDGVVDSLYEGHIRGMTTEDERDYKQSTVWWFTSVAFPLIASTFGPIASLLSICGLIQSWLISKASGARIPDPGWLLALNVVSLVLALLANLLLLFNFAKRIPYVIAQPLTIIFLYLSCILLLVPVIITHSKLLHRQPSYGLSQSYYYAFIATIAYFIIATLLLFNLLGSCIFNVYPPSFAQLDRPQRTLMLQTVVFSAYLALGAAIFSSIENWTFVDAIYWADYTLLTIGLGSDFPVKHTAGRMILIPFAAVGILIVGLIVSSVRALVVRRARTRITKHHLQQERKKWIKTIEKLSNGTEAEAKDAEKKFMMTRERWFKRNKIRVLEKEGNDEQKRWRIREFMLMRFIAEEARKTEEYIALAFSVLFFAIVWVGGSIVFWTIQLSPDATPWTYPESLYFTYTSILTIGYGDFVPATASGRPFFVIWSLLAVPSLTVLIQNVGDTIAREVQNVIEWAGSWSILPEKLNGNTEETDLNNEGEAANVWDRKRRGPFQILRNGKPRKGKTDKGKGRLEAEEESTDRAPSASGLPASEISPQLTTISRARQGPFEMPPLLSVRLSREITKVARDAIGDTSITYGWREWVSWLRLMDEAGEMSGLCGPCQHTDGFSGSIASNEGFSNPCGMNFHVGQRPQQRQNDEGSDGRTRPRMTRTTTTLVDKLGWGWLDDNGPLFSSMTESQWILERLCILFERVAGKEHECGQREEDGLEG